MIIDVKNLTKIYSNGVKALDNISFSVDKNIIYGLLGPNGAGKTTTIKILTTLLRPTEGTVKILDFIRPRDDEKIREIIGYVPQDISADQSLTGYENLVISAKLHGLKNYRERIEEILKNMDLYDAKDRLVKTYSGGMIRRLEIAQAMLHEPKILFLDEPTVGLDPRARNNVWEYINNLKKNSEITIIMTTHYMEEAQKLCNVVSIMNRGRIVVTDSPSNLGDLEKAFIKYTGEEYEETSTLRDITKTRRIARRLE